MKLLALPLLLFVAVSLAGCGEEVQGNPNNGYMGLSYESLYQGASRGDDDDVYAHEKFPTDDDGNLRLVAGGSRGYGGVASCLAGEPEWEGKWWLEVSLYEEYEESSAPGEVGHGRGFIEEQRWDIDCLQYWISIDEDGHMTFHEGNPPWDQPAGIPGLEIFGVLVAIGGSFVAHRWSRFN